MLASSLSLLGPIVLCLVVYLRWQLGGGADEILQAPLRAIAAAPQGVANACRFEPSSAAAAEVLDACAPGRALHATPGPSVADGGAESARETDRSRMPGIYVDAGGADLERRPDATIRGALLADRIVHGRFGAGELRRGERGALDVIVVGANLFGISATLRLMQAGLRVLLVDRHSWAPLDAPSHRFITSPPGAARRVRLPLVTGHRVSVVAQRADGMLEVQAERAAWYTANVIFASRSAVAGVDERSGSPSAPVDSTLVEPVAEAPSAPPRAA